ncbi:hypothetical protein M413DRAFT_197696 [Hebeloma cylindrosporum]|uniref:Uncharacterized protein n=1 Tax=Hebeloma cylindrosporum TaxID=76867 RepID=A0A0C3C6V4_HEBCY|nr:hypothetical protein M413DRAFT_197696 [Hebeloma cylindrosporum h7]
MYDDGYVSTTSRVFTTVPSQYLTTMSNWKKRERTKSMTNSRQQGEKSQRERDGLHRWGRFRRSGRREEENTVGTGDGFLTRINISINLRWKTHNSVFTSKRERKIPQLHPIPPTETSTT